MTSPVVDRSNRYALCLRALHPRYGTPGMLARRAGPNAAPESVPAPGLSGTTSRACGAEERTPGTALASIGDRGCHTQHLPQGSTASRWGARSHAADDSYPTWPWLSLCRACGDRAGTRLSRTAPEPYRAYPTRARPGRSYADIPDFH